LTWTTSIIALSFVTHPPTQPTCNVANSSTLPAESIPTEWQQYFNTTATANAASNVISADQQHGIITTHSSRTIIEDDPGEALAMASPPSATYITSPAGGELHTVGGYSSSHGSKYTYTYESHVEEPECSSLDYLAQSSTAATYHPASPDGTEKHEQTSQKVTRVTKITTTRSVKQVPVDPNDLCFDAEGNPMLAHGEFNY